MGLSRDTHQVPSFHAYEMSEMHQSSCATAPLPRQFIAMNTRTIGPIGLRYPAHRPALADCHLRRQSYPCSSNENAA
jgi:hypothetical protein